jgi:hypothetical protein
MLGRFEAAVSAKIEQALEENDVVETTLTEKRELIDALERGSRKPRSHELRALEIGLRAAVYAETYLKEQIDARADTVIKAAPDPARPPWNGNRRGAGQTPGSVCRIPPGEFGLNFNSRTPMSVGVWVLLVASIFALVAFIDSLVRDERFGWPPALGVASLLDGTVGLVWNIIGTTLYLFIAGYTGVLIAVSNQPVWSDSWALGGLFLASGLAGSAALLLLLARWRAVTEWSLGVLETSEGLFTVLELLLLVIVVLTLIDDGTLDTAFGSPWILLWLVAFVGMLPCLIGLRRPDARSSCRGGERRRRRVPAGAAMDLRRAVCRARRRPRAPRRRHLQRSGLTRGRTRRPPL